MADETTRVDVLSLEDFRATLVTRLREADSILHKLTTELGGRKPALGTFVDGSAKAAEYSALYDQHVDRVNRLRRAIIAAQEATDTIIDNYRTTEARNGASASDIANKLDGVANALDGEQAGA
ncbi:MAG TPA: hypothetical protein VEK80_07945 [Kribbellaceae bacterium]|nr:hypothetical protein [Kribbellaceae bacterium]